MPARLRLSRPPLTPRGRAARRLAGVAALTTAALIAPGVASAATFPAATQLSDAYPQVDSPDVAVDTAGDAVAVWTTYTTSAAPSSGVLGRKYVPPPTSIQVSVRHAGGAFGAPVALSTPGVNSTDTQVTMNARGDATVVWVEMGATGVAVHTSTLAAGASAFSAPQTISDPTRAAEEPSIAIADDGSATIAWTDTDATYTQAGTIQSASRVGLAAFGAPVKLSTAATSGDATQPTVAIDARGDQAVSWTDGGSEAWLTQAAAGQALSSAGTKMIQSAGESAVQPQIVIGPTGTVTYVYWNRVPGATPGSYTFGIRSRLVQPDGSVSAPQTLTTQRSYFDTSLAIDRTGRATLAIEYPVPTGVGNNVTVSLDAVTAQPGSAFAAPVTLDTSVGGAGPSVASGSDGSTLVAWRHATTEGSQIVQSAIRPGGADAFGATQTLSTASYYDVPATAISTPDIATVLWVQDPTGAPVVTRAGLATPTYAVFGTSTGSGVAPPAPTPVIVAVTTHPPLLPVPAPKLTLGAVTQTGKKPKKGSKKVPAGPKTVSVSVTSDLASTVTATITKASKGVLKSGTTTCVAPPKKPAKGKKPKPCTRQVAVGAPVVASANAGTATVLTFAKKTPVGKYTLTLTAKGLTGLYATPVSTPLKVK